MTWAKWKTAIVAGGLAVLTLSVGSTAIVGQALAQRADPPEQYIRPAFQNAFSKERFAELKANVWPAEKAAVQGSIQLMGHGMDRYHKTYPEQVSGIVVDRRAAKLHVLQGSNWTYPNAYGTTVARLVLHYEDGSTRDVDMIAGDHMFDWWSPLFKTGIPPRYFKMGPTTERAWSGSNPFIKRVWPGESVVLYKSTFANPQPDVRISNIDFVSSMKLTAPFIVAITVE